MRANSLSRSVNASGGHSRQGFWRAVVVVGCVLCGCLWGVAASAEQETDAESSVADLTELSIESLLDLKVTTASKKSERLGESPAAVFVVDAEDISRYGYRTLGDALHSVVGLYTTSDRSFSYLGVRGLSRFGDYNGRILLLVDGHRLNDPIFDTATIGEDCPVDIESVERIEVVKGPGSSLWGTNALLATVNVITRRGSDIAGGRIVADSEKLFTEFGGMVGEDLEVGVSVSGVNSDGERSIYFPEFDSPDTNNGFATNVDSLNATRVHLDASYKGLRLLANRGKRTKVFPTAAYDTLFNDPGTKIDEDRVNLELSYETQGTEISDHSLLARVYADQYRYIGDYAYDYPPRVINRDHDFSKWWGAEIRRSDAVSERLSLTYGAEYQRLANVVQGNYDVDPYYDYYTIRSTRTTRSIYAQANYTASDNLHLTLGTRCDDYSSFGSTWSPRAAAVYSLSDRDTVKLLCGSAFRAPNLYEVAWGDPSLPPIQPERVASRELVWERGLGSNSRLVMSLFKFEIKDVISLIETEDSWYIANQGTDHGSGFEAFYETRSSYGTRGYAGVCLTNASANDTLLANSPSYLFNCGISAPVLSHRYYLSPQIRGIGRVLTDTGESIRPATVVDLAVTSASNGRGPSVSLGAYNLFDKQIYAPAPAELTQERVPQVGRVLRLTVSQRF